MPDDAAVAWNALEILLAECFRRLESDNWREHFSPRLLEALETLANRARINSPARFHQSPFNSETIVSLWCPWTIECTFAGTQSEFDFGTIKTTLEKWTSWGHFYKAGGEPDLVIRNQNLWPPSGADWEKRTGIRESECQSLLDSRDSRGLSSLFSVSPRAFVFALGSWLTHLDEVFDIPNKNTWTRELRGHVTKKHLADIRDVLCLISEAHANVEHKSGVAKFDRGSITWFDETLKRMLTYQTRSLCFIDSHPFSKDAFIDFDCRNFERTLMQSWLTELAHSTDRRPACQVPPPKADLPGGLDTAARKAGNVPYWDDANSTLWLNGNDRCYAGQLAEESRGIFNSLEKENWTQAAPCSIPATRARQCCRDRSNDNKLGIKFKYQTKPKKTVSATWEKLPKTPPKLPQNSPKTPPKLPQTPEPS